MSFSQNPILLFPLQIILNVSFQHRAIETLSAKL